MSPHHHFLLICFPGQGHINPTLQLAKNLIRARGCHTKVTFATTVYGLSQIKNLPTLDNLTYAAFSDGHDHDGFRRSSDMASYMAEFKRVGSQTVAKLVRDFFNEGRPVTFLVYSILLPWGASVAREMNIPSAFLVIHCATAFAIYRHFFTSVYDGVIGNIDPSLCITFPGLPTFTSTDLPSFLVPGNRYVDFMIPIMEQHIKALENDPKPCALLNTFDALEKESLKYLDNMNVITIGPLIPSAFIDGKDQQDKSFGADLLVKSEDYVDWLDSQPEHSVIYVSFGSLAVISKEQKQEILHGLVASGRPFLWVLRSIQEEGEEVKEMVENGITKNGVILPWCSQLEVLSHKSIGCFITHCGWNSTLESLSSGVPLIGCPQFSDQLTNVKLVQDVWGVGVKAVANEEQVVERAEIMKCLDVVLGNGERSREIRQNALKWKYLAIDAVKEGGSSYNNLHNFLNHQE